MSEDPKATFSLVTAEMFPDGVVCMKCKRTLLEGSPYAEQLNLMRDDGIPICRLLCVYCAVSDEKEERKTAHRQINELDKRINYLRNTARWWGTVAAMRDHKTVPQAQRETYEAEAALRDYLRRVS